MEINQEKAIEKLEFEPVAIKVINFDTKIDIICTSGDPIQGEGEDL